MKITPREIMDLLAPYVHEIWRAEEHVVGDMSLDGAVYNIEVRSLRIPAKNANAHVIEWRRHLFLEKVRGYQVVPDELLAIVGLAPDCWPPD